MLRAIMNRSSYILDFGIVLLVLTTVSTLTGVTFDRYRGFVYRTEDPKQFRWNVVMYYLFALLFLLCGLILKIPH